jgi:hypothetical protein
MIRNLITHHDKAEYIETQLPDQELHPTMPVRLPRFAGHFNPYLR